MVVPTTLSFDEDPGAVDASSKGGESVVVAVDEPVILGRSVVNPPGSLYP
jgi:hypothetical protein